MNKEQLVCYLHEVGYLKLLKRSGWWRLGVKDPETVAEHCFRAAIIGYILATLDGVDAYKTATMCLFHDVAETRISDLPWVARRYLHDVKEAEETALCEQTDQLPEPLSRNILDLMREYRQQTSQEAQLAREADLLECLLQAREYYSQGYSKGMEWAKICRDGLQSETARNLADLCLEGDPGEWFQDLQDNPHKGSF
ncbi:MAG: HD family hydrolase [Thermogemmatispora sp.]|uniref:HD domain-containing protein n=1 Tax=Thermogemmatispora sp. TaxID=1968838 RepID=UPI002636DDA1|nr:HD family hydrolase [Thermogemmatispora sp.]MBX5457790.1 HD family hydrolase [Thermogemmatispora sp.]